MVTLVAFVLVLGIVVFVHELGHFLLARAHGVRVETFSVGMGPKLLTWRRGPTLFCLSAIPLGGYLRLAGGRLLDQGTGAPDEFRSKTRWVRAQIYLAGPLANVGLAIVLGAIAYAFGPPPDLPEIQGRGVVERVLPGSPADRAGFRPGDRLLSAGVMSCHCTLGDIRYLFDTSESTTVDVEILRDGTTMLLEVPRPPERTARFDRLGLVLRVEPMPVVVGVDPTGARLAGASGPARPPDGPAATSRPGVVSAARAVTAGMAAVVADVPAALWDAVDDRPPEQLIMGPIGIARLSGQAARSGWMTLIAWTSLISLGLAFTNLLPIPVVDGGQICILAAEAVCRRDAGIRTRTVLALVGLAMLVGLLGTATVLDLRALS